MRSQLICFCALALTACGGERITTNAPPPPAEYLQCAALPERPALDPLQAYALADGSLVYAKPATDARDSVIARYLLALRAAHFDCSNQLRKVEGYLSETGE